MISRCAHQINLIVVHSFNVHHFNLETPEGDHKTKMPKKRSHKTNILTIATKPTPENLSQCNPQTASPLFSVLPPEIRNYIFYIALTPYEDLSNPYPENDFCYRPGHRAKLLLSTTLLLTCRRIWLEANHWPMEQTVHTFWYDESRRPPWQRQSAVSRLHRLNQSLTPTQQAALKHVQIFAQMYWLEGKLCSNSALLDSVEVLFSGLETFTITVRHSDWWFWESDDPLVLKVEWVRELLRSRKVRHVKELRLELETLERKMGQLRPILAELGGLMRDGERFQCVAPQGEWTWSGPTDLGGHESAVYRGLERLDYRVVRVRWRQGLQRGAGEEGDGLHVTIKEEDGESSRERKDETNTLSIITGSGHQSSSLSSQQSSSTQTQHHHHHHHHDVTPNQRTRPIRLCRYRKEHTLLRHRTIPSISTWQTWNSDRERRRGCAKNKAARDRYDHAVQRLNAADGSSRFNGALGEYQVSSMLLDFRNKRRLEIARAEQVEATGGVDDG